MPALQPPSTSAQRTLLLTPCPAVTSVSAARGRGLLGLGKGLGGAAYAPSYVGSAYVAPAYVQPTYVQSAYVQPTYVQSYAQPGA